MNLSFKIAKKYFFSKKKRGFIHFISLISILGVGVGSAALIIVLSVFNGLEDLNREIFKAIYPDLQITKTDSKTFPKTSLDLNDFHKNESISTVMEVLEDNALGKQDNDQLIINIKGVSQNFEKLDFLKSSVLEGNMTLNNEISDFSFVGVGVYNFLNLSLNDFLRPLEIWYPKNQKLDVLNPEGNINKILIPVSGVFALEQNYDNYVFLPIEMAEILTDKKDQRSAIEVYLKNDTEIEKVKNEIGKFLPKGFVVKDRDQLNEALFRAIRIEKLFIFIALLFIIGIASFNIFFSLSMLVLDKKDDIETLSAMGADKKMIRNIFLKEGFLISFSGAIIGIIIGSAICLSQMYFGWLKMGMEFSIVDAYPVVLNLQDVLISFAGIVLITILATYFPAQKAVSFMKSN